MRFISAIIISAITCVNAFAESNIGPVAPSAFSAAIWGFGGPSYKVTLINGKLHYFNSRAKPPAQNPVIITPTNEQWKEFKKCLDEIGVYQWEKLYPKKGVDGTEWALSINYGNKSITTSGHNNFPLKSGEGSKDTNQTPEFIRLRKAISTLIGNRKFE